MGDASLCSKKGGRMARIWMSEGHSGPIHWNRMGNLRSSATLTRCWMRSRMNSPSTSTKDSKAFFGDNPTERATLFCQSETKGDRRSRLHVRYDLRQFGAQFGAFRN